MLKIGRPFYWHPGVGRSGKLRGASTFILQFESGHYAVTADHVLVQYLAAKEADPRMICQIGQCQVWPERSIVARSAALDIATFAIDPAQLETMGAIALDCRRDWPPPDVAVGDTLALVGYLDDQRTEVGRGHYAMEAWGANAVADAVSDRDILTVYDPEATLEAGTGAGKPPLGFNMSGCSGGPAVVVKDIKGILRWQPVGLIYKGPGEKKAEGEFATFDRIHVRKIHFIQPDGSIQEPHVGWLPS